MTGPVLRTFVKGETSYDINLLNWETNVRDLEMNNTLQQGLYATGYVRLAIPTNIADAAVGSHAEFLAGEIEHCAQHFCAQHIQSWWNGEFLALIYALNEDRYRKLPSYIE
ncbi:hypothetical protein AAHE18_11G180600 [Arachis hypogaea]